MTTDFVVTIRMDSGSTKCIAYTFKYWNQLFEHQEDGSVKQIKARTWQKFAIEREYWRVRGVEYRVITELDTTKPCAWNIEYFELAHDLVASSDELKEFGQAFIETWTEIHVMNYKITLRQSKSLLITHINEFKAYFSTLACII